MKYTAVAAALFAGLVSAQGDVGSLPQCGQYCITSMLGKAQSLGCGQSDIACLCKNTDFTNGVHDCTVESCPSASQAQILQFGSSLCAAAAASGSGIATVTVPTGSATLVVSTGTDSAGNGVTTTLGGAGAGGVVTVTATNSGMYSEHVWK
ncbi:MAG: hypothetical protein LQ340_006246 [Diploschistes diacapsis]|nr:MAG: hypothetical protein LQ340_006246 [Diploschistes diacapsis]